MSVHSYVDTHCHLDTVLQRLKLQTLAQLKRRCPAGLEGVVAIFCDPAAFSPSFGVWESMLAEDGVYGAFGLVCHAGGAVHMDGAGQLAWSDHWHAVPCCA